MLIFTLIPISILWIKNFKFLKKNIKIILIACILGIIHQFVSDPFAESWGAWFFNSEKILNVWILNFPLENVIFVILVSFVISSAVLTFIHYQEEGKFKILKKVKIARPARQKTI